LTHGASERYARARIARSVFSIATIREMAALVSMVTRHLPAFVAFTLTSSGLLAAPQLPGVGAAMQRMIDQHEIAGAVTVVVSKDKTLHLESTGFADTAARKPISAESLFWIASMSKPITGTAIMILQDEGKLNVADPVAKYIPEFANLKTPSGKPANLTLTQILTHTSGLGEASPQATLAARTLADLVPVWLAAPMQYEPGAKWKYTQSGINLAGRIVEVVSGLSYDAFLQRRIFGPLGMQDTTFYPTDVQRARLAQAYAKNKTPARSRPCRCGPNTMARARCRRRGMAACFPRRPITRGSAGCCSTAARSTANAS